MKRAKPRRAERFSALEIFRVPILLSGLMAVGLLAALLGDGIWDAVSWIGLSIPLAVLAWYAGIRMFLR